MAPRLSPEVKVKIEVFLELKWSTSVIIKYFSEQNISVSVGSISNIRNKKENNQNVANKLETRGRKSVLSKSQLLKLEKMTTNPNPMTQQAMANRLNTSQQVISYQIKKKLNKKLLKKPKGHQLSAKTIEKRFRRSWPLYRTLRGQRWTKVITSDEAWFYLDNTGRNTKVQYLSRGQIRSSLDTSTHSSHLKGIMVWIGISANGCTKVRFVTPGAKINSDYYVKKVLTPFIKEDIPKLYPDGH
jgi:hypothetical protein